MDTWDVLKLADVTTIDNSKVYLIYGYNDLDGINKTDRSRDINLSCHTSSCLGKWNREHVYSKSRATPKLETGRAGTGTDAHNLRPADGQMNSSRNNRLFAEGKGNSHITSSGNWYPGDEWKGDVARTIMYMHVRYPSQCPANNISFSNHNNHSEMADIFLKWNLEDPVSLSEMRRNDVLQSAQGNRNPFIDNPYLATKIWGGEAAENKWYNCETNLEIELVGNPIQCIGSTANIELTSKTANDFLSYQWLISNDGVNFEIINGETSKKLNPSTLEVGNKFYRLQKSPDENCGLAYSNTISVRTIPKVEIEINEIDKLICTDAGITLSVNKSIDKDLESGVNYQWYSSVDNNNFSIISGATNPTYKPQTAQKGINYYSVDAIFNGNECGSSTPKSLAVVPQMSLTMFPIDTTVCGGTPITLQANSNTSIQEYSVQWFVSSDSLTFAVLENINTLSFSPETSNSGKQFYSIQGTPNSPYCKAFYSDTTSVRTLPKVEIEINEIDKLICTEADITLTVNKSIEKELEDVITYQWFSSIDNKSFSAIPEATDSTYKPQTTFSGTYYYSVDAIYNGNKCGSTASKSLEVIPQMNLTILPNDNIVCEGTPITLQANANTSSQEYALQWFVSDDSLNFSKLDNVNTLSFSPKTFASGRNFYSVQGTPHSPYCKTFNADTVSVEILTPVSVNIIQPDEPLYMGDDVTLNLDILRVNGSETYQWYESPDNITFAPISDAIKESYKITSRISGERYYKVEVIDTINTCRSTVSSIIRVNILQLSKFL
jgi:endonuclease I